ncbi:BolA family protein [Alteromonas lipolytica]|uniref:Transcriptional regulator n=1 Tax=Alteromonas lipolytica TaxID=1856405 RepID=A0A1E8FDN3_9ALTE|nr:BolA family protein [Alteromonas lipolytica]OFI33698.1 transcriptional regulator [Alteromonas lipolytica]GGF69261.1 DNA-binding transcriptional regulator BolA [Alteromonas lipolytica]
MRVKPFIEQQLNTELTPEYLEVVDESYMHSGPDDGQSHFKVTVVSSAFEGQRLIARHRQVNTLLADALAGPVHALAMHTYTPAEWQQRNQVSVDSPACRGGSQAG